LRCGIRAPTIPKLARRLTVDERVVRRMLDPAHETKAEKIQAALAVLGKRLTMEVEDAVLPARFQERKTEHSAILPFAKLARPHS
jgi:hypothetical protein